MSRRRPSTSALGLAALCLWMVATPKALWGGGPSWGGEVSVHAGLDTLLRGAEAGLSLGYGADNWSLSLRATLGQDLVLSSTRLGLGLALALGPRLSLEAAWEVGLTEAHLTETTSGALVSLASAGLPSRLGLAVDLLDLGLPRGGRWRGRLVLVGRLEWSAYRIVGVTGGEDAREAVIAALAGREGFAAGFRAGLALSWRKGTVVQP